MINGLRAFGWKIPPPKATFYVWAKIPKGFKDSMETAKAFLEKAESLHVDCEHLTSNQKVWLRVAFDTEDKGKVFGRGGRNIQAVGTILQTAATNANQLLHLDIYNSDRNKENTKPPHKKKSRPNIVEKKNNKVIL